MTSRVAKPIKRQVVAHYMQKGNLVGEVEENDILEILEFDIPNLASVSAKFGVTINMGNYEAARFDAMVTVPCYVEEIDNAMKFAETKAEGFTRDQAAEYLKRREEEE